MKHRLLNLKIMGDERGSLIAFEEAQNVPFDVKRVYCIFNTDVNARRGKHAHKDLKQVLFCPTGSCTILLDDGYKKVEVSLDSPDKGLYIEGTIWREMYKFSPDCVLTVLANDYYNENEYIRNYEEFLKLVRNG
jgi:dTDP-4-dehydrorhamnose 3,5-epimerase-like enzyme